MLFFVHELHQMKKINARERAVLKGSLVVS